MRLVLRKWGNSLAVRLPRDDPTYGRLEEGMEIEIEARPVRKTSKPLLTFTGGPPDLVEMHDQYRLGMRDEEIEKWQSSIRVSSSHV